MKTGSEPAEILLTQFLLPSEHGSKFALCALEEIAPKCLISHESPTAF